MRALLSIPDISKILSRLGISGGLFTTSAFLQGALGVVAAVFGLLAAIWAWRTARLSHQKGQIQLEHAKLELEAYKNAQPPKI
jgi:hypothetical protein